MAKILCPLEKRQMRMLFSSLKGKHVTLAELIEELTTLWNEEEEKK